MSVVHAGPVRRLGRHVIIVQTERHAVALEREQQVSHISRVRQTVIAGRHVAERVHREHVVRRVAALVPGDHAGHIGVREMRFHLRQEARVIQAQGDVRRDEEILVRAVEITLHVLPAEGEPGALIEDALVREDVPNTPRDVPPVMVVADKIDSFHTEK